MHERQAKLIFDSEESVPCRRFLQSRCIADVLDEVNLDDHRYLIVEDKHGCILGIVETEDLLLKTTSADPVERRRWCEMPLEAAISARLDAYSPEAHPLKTHSPEAVSKGKPTIDPPREVRATTISSGSEELAALFLDDDLYLKWSSIKQILHHALVDTVTGLPNRMVFERRLTEEWQRIQRSSGSLCVLLIDLDYFKKVNDEFGHSVGDLVLKEIGNTLQKQLRSYDLLVRYGGDEFAAILTDCTAAQLAIPIQRIQSGLRQLSIDGYETLPTFSLSIGAVTIRSQSDIHSISDLVQEADVCLYEAKENGRDCAYISDLASRNPQPGLVEGELAGAAQHAGGSS